MFADVAANDFAMLGTAVGQDVLDEVVAKLVTSNCRELAFTPIYMCYATYCR